MREPFSLGYDQHGKLVALIIHNDGYQEVKLTFGQFSDLGVAIKGGLRRTERVIQHEANLARLEEMKAAARAKYRFSPVDVARAEEVKKVKHPRHTRARWKV